MFNQTRPTRVDVMEQTKGSNLKAQTVKEEMNIESLSKTAIASGEKASLKTWHEFVSESSLHGIKYAANPKINLCRR